jgi:hypothetical protein
MADPAQSDPSGSDQPTSRQRLWNDVEPTARAMVGDAVLFLLGLLVLAGSFLGLLGLDRLGYPKSFIDILEALHFWGYFAVLGVLLLDLLWKVAAHAFWNGSFRAISGISPACN